MIRASPFPFATKTLAAIADATAPDGTAVRLLLALAGGSMAHFELPAGAVSHAVTHRTVEELWYVVCRPRALFGAVSDGAERIEALAPGIAVDHSRSGRRSSSAPRRPRRSPFVAITMPPWPGMRRGAAGPRSLDPNRPCGDVSDTAQGLASAAGPLVAKAPSAGRFSSVGRATVL